MWAPGDAGFSKLCLALVLAGRVDGEVLLALVEAKRVDGEVLLALVVAGRVDGEVLLALVVAKRVDRWALFAQAVCRSLSTSLLSTQLPTRTSTPTLAPASYHGLLFTSCSWSCHFKALGGPLMMRASRSDCAPSSWPWAQLPEHSHVSLSSTGTHPLLMQRPTPARPTGTVADGLSPS